MYSSQWNYSGYLPTAPVTRTPGVPSAFRYWPSTAWMQQSAPPPPKPSQPAPATQWVVPPAQPVGQVVRREKRDRVVDTLLKIIPTIVRSIVAELQPRREILGPPEVPLTRPPTAQTVIYETRWQKPEEGTVVPTMSTQAVGDSPQPMPRGTSSSSSDDPELRITLPPTVSQEDVLVTPLTMNEGPTPWPSSTPAKSPVRNPRPCSNCGHVSDPK